MSWTKVDDVWVVHADEPGPLRATLTFRVGKADETLPTNGITHLVEHLTLFPLGQRPHYQNGSVRTSVTTFDTSGEPEEVARFLTGVCTGLSSLPVDRLETEVRVLDTEAGKRGYGTSSALLSWRFGPAGPGLWSFDEFATATVDGAALQQWATERFTRENAVLVLSAPPPPGLTLPLPPGPRRDVPALEEVLPATPAWFRHGFPDVAALAPVPRSVAAVAYSYALQNALVDKLRFELGVAYSPTVDYDPYDGSTALMWITGDSHPEHLDQVAQVLAGTIASLADDGTSSERLEEYRTNARKLWDSPDASVALAYTAAMELLMTGAVTPLQQRIAEVEAVTLDDVHAFARTVRDSLLYGLPEGAELTAGQAEPAPELSTEEPVEGTSHALIGGNSRSDRMVVAPEGISGVRADGVHATVRFATARAVLAWPDGRRVLIAPDGVTVTVEPTLWESGEQIVTVVDAATAGVRVPRTARNPEDIPLPPTPPSTGLGRLWERQNGRRSTGSWLMIGSAAVILLVAATTFGSSGQTSSSSGAGIARTILITIGVLAGVFGLSRK
ncbi:insulinase family protein [Longivirga aurantiaca]|uniref:Insulinase family protein n=1 Tax=Longivirga aurantiaca TaxID=1837743 RepID=A0ABW1SZK7_9ACTN